MWGWVHLQVGQQVAGLSHSGPGGVQLDLQLLLSLPQAADLRLRRAQVLLALPHQLLQVGHLQYHSSEGRGGAVAIIMITYQHEKY